MKTIYWAIAPDHARPLDVLFETEKSLLVRSNYGEGEYSEFQFAQKDKNKEWFETSEAAIAFTAKEKEKAAKIEEFKKQLELA